jgi:hypothetical protein
MATAPLRQRHHSSGAGAKPTGRHGTPSLLATQTRLTLSIGNRKVLPGGESVASTTWRRPFLRKQLRMGCVRWRQVHDGCSAPTPATYASIRAASQNADQQQSPTQSGSPNPTRAQAIAKSSRFPTSGPCPTAPHVFVHKCFRPQPRPRSRSHTFSDYSSCHPRGAFRSEKAPFDTPTSRPHRNEERTLQDAAATSFSRSASSQDRRTSRIGS